MIENYESQDRKMREDDGEGGGEGCTQMRRRQGEQQPWCDLVKTFIQIEKNDRWLRNVET